MAKKTKKISTEEERIKKKLVILTVVFIISFLTIISYSLDFFNKLSLNDFLNPEGNVDWQLEQDVRAMVKGYPIERMAPQIAKKDRKVAAYLVSIAKKESNWGKRVPVLAGRDCYNYWGYRGKSDEIGSGGHTCFNNPREAVNVVADRIDELINDYELDSPEKLIVWKCGYTCEGHSKYSVRKWISDVSFYYDKIVN